MSKWNKELEDAVAALRPCKRLTVRGGRRLATIRSSAIGLAEGVRTGFRLLTIRSPTLVVCGASARLSVRSRFPPIRRRLVSIRLGAALRPGERLAVRGSRRTTIRGPALPVRGGWGSRRRARSLPGQRNDRHRRESLRWLRFGRAFRARSIVRINIRSLRRSIWIRVAHMSPFAESPVDRVKSLLPQPATCNAVCT